MTQNQLNQAISRITGEDLATIRRIGFSIADPDDVSFDPERPLRRRSRIRILNWDRLATKRYGYLSQRSRYRR